MGMSAPFFAAADTLLVPPAAALLIAATAYVAGRTLTRAVPARGPLEIAALSVAAGLLALAHLGLALGWLGHLARGPVLAAFGALHLLGHRAWRELAAAARAAHTARGARLTAAHAAPPNPTIAVRTTPASSAAAVHAAPARSAAGLILGLALAPAVLLALEPPLGFDATMYHLPYAKAFAATGHLPFLPALRFPIFPQLNEMLFALALLLDGDGAAQLLMVLATLLTAAFLVAWGRSAFGERSAAGALAAAALAGNPLVVYLAGSAYVDAALALWVTAALYCLHRFRQGAAPSEINLPAAGRSHRSLTPSGRSIPSPPIAGRLGWIVLAGAFAGGAAAGKYLGLFFVAAIAVIVVWSDRRRALWFAAAAAAIMAPWYGRIFYYTHNPVFPYFPQWFGSSPWDPLLFRPVLSLGTLSPAVWLPALGARLLALLRLPWDLSVGWRAAGAIAPLSPACLAALPLLAAGFWRDGRIRRLLLLAAAFAFATLLLPREPRYVLAALPLVSLATGAVIADCLTPLAASGWAVRGRRRGLAASTWAVRGWLVRGWRRGLTASLCAALLLPGWLYGIDRLRRLGLPPASSAAREAFLTRQLRLYPAIRFLNRTYGNAYTAYGWQTENLHYFAAGSLLGDWSGPASYTRMPAVGGDPETLAQALRRLGADHLVLPAAAAAPGCSGSAAFRRRFDRRFADSNACVFALTAPAGSAAGARR
jgi:hypothetical protein